MNFETFTDLKLWSGDGSGVINQGSSVHLLLAEGWSRTVVFFYHPRVCVCVTVTHWELLIYEPTLVWFEPVTAWCGSRLILVLWWSSSSYTRSYSTEPKLKRMTLGFHSKWHQLIYVRSLPWCLALSPDLKFLSFPKLSRDRYPNVPLLHSSAVVINTDRYLYYILKRICQEQNSQQKMSEWFFILYIKY